MEIQKSTLLKGGIEKMKKQTERREPCCNMGKCPSCPCCICICTRDLKNSLSGEAREVLLRELS